MQSAISTRPIADGLIALAVSNSRPISGRVETPLVRRRLMDGISRSWRKADSVHKKTWAAT
jgi:hypothetical protein